MFMFNFFVIKQTRFLLSTRLYCQYHRPTFFCKYVWKNASDDNDEIKLKYTSVPVDDNEKFEIWDLLELWWRIEKFQN